MNDDRAGARDRRDQLSLFDLPVAPRDPDADARAFAVDPRHHVFLEASAGTGKTSVLVARYLNLLKSGVDPSNILAMTFTRKAAAEMRERIVRELGAAASRAEIERERWLGLRDRLDEIAVGTIDAFCLSLLREFPLEADVDPAFELADETEVPRLIATALDRSLRMLVGMAQHDPDLALVLAQLGIARTRAGLAMLLDRRLVAEAALDRFLARGRRDLTAAGICRAAARSLHDTLQSIPGGLARFLADGPARHPRYALLGREISRLGTLEEAPEAMIRALLDRITAHFLTYEGKARKAGQIPPYTADDYATKEAAKRHREAVFQTAPRVEAVMQAFNRDLNVVLARGVRRMFAIALKEYRCALDERSVLDFSEVLHRALTLLTRMDEFSQSRYRLESRYHHVLVDEFQDTSRAQWQLVSLLVQAWGAGAGLAANPSIFIVGDRKQSIYRFRDAEVEVLHEAGRFIEALRPQAGARRSIVRSFRAVPELLCFVNDVFTEASAARADPAAVAEQVPTDPGAAPARGRRTIDRGAFVYEQRDRFPVDTGAAGRDAWPVTALGLAVAETPEACAAVVAEEVLRLIGGETIRDKGTGLARAVRPGDIAILFRSRTSHRELERELGARGIPSYVYKGLGFFDADEIKDLVALLRYLADPSSSLRAAALMRSRLLRLSDQAVAALAPDLALALVAATPTDRPPRSPAVMAPADAALSQLSERMAQLDEEDRQVLAQARLSLGHWLALVDRVPPAELVDHILAESAYAFEIGDRRRRQAWENIKKMRGLIRRMQNRGYATLPRIAEHLQSLSAGDESNAVVEALDAVNLLTVHAAKGLEFPIVFVVNLARGASGPPRPVRVFTGGGEEGDEQFADAEEASVSVGSFMSATDEAERERERHETRRLLYVALTRPRERLYLASALKDGRLAPGRGSLAEVLPESIRALFNSAHLAPATADTLIWTGEADHAHTWRLCRAAQPAAGLLAIDPAGMDPAAVMTGDVEMPTNQAPIDHAPTGQVPCDDFAAPAAASTLPRWLAADDEGLSESEIAVEESGGPSDKLFGMLTHRLFEAIGHLGDRPSTDLAGEPLRRLADRLLRPEERAGLTDPDRLVMAAADAWALARSRPDVTLALAGVDRMHEVPVSLMSYHGNAAKSPHLIRGTVDCVVVRSDGSLKVVELKTGRARTFHQRQLMWYVRAVRALCPGVTVDGVVLYL